MKKELALGMMRLPVDSENKIVEDFSNRKTSNAKTAVLKNAIKIARTLHFLQFFRATQLFITGTNNFSCGRQVWEPFFQPLPT